MKKRKYDYSDRKDLHVFIKRDVADRIRALALIQGKKLNKLVEEILEDYIAAYEAETLAKL